MSIQFVGRNVIVHYKGTKFTVSKESFEERLGISIPYDTDVAKEIILDAIGEV